MTIFAQLVDYNVMRKDLVLKMTVYGDLLFLINFSMDFLCFYLSFLLIGERIRALRACIASAIGGIYSVAALFIDTDGALALMMDIFALLVMCMTVYCSKGLGIKRFIKRTALYFIVSSLLGGFMTAVFSILNRMDALGEGGDIEDGIDVWVFAILVLISSALTLSGGKIFRHNGSKKTVTVEISDGGKGVALSALVDTGNLAYEPISGKSVVFASVDACRSLFSESDYLSLKNGKEIDQLSFPLAMRIRPIYCCSIGGNKLFPSIRFKSTCLVHKKRKKELDVYVALVNDDMISGYDAIISNELTI